MRINYNNLKQKTRSKCRFEVASLVCSFNQHLLILLMTSPNKLTLSQSTLFSRPRDTNFTCYTPKEGQSLLKNPYNQTLPLKFPSKQIVKQCSYTMLDQTSEGLHRSSVRIFAEHNRSRFFEGSPLPLTQTELISRHPQYLFDSYNQRKLANPGVFGHLSRESLEYPIRLRSYEDIGTVNNGKRIFSRMHYRPDPIITPTQDKHFNSTLDRTWREARRHRDNGIECEKVIHQAVKIKKRQPYKQPKQTPTNINKVTSYKQIYLRSRGLIK